MRATSHTSALAIGAAALLLSLPILPVSAKQAPQQPVQAQQPMQAQPQQRQAEIVEITAVRGPIYMIAGAGANITLSAGNDGLLLVDTGTAAMSAQVLAAISRLPQFISPTGAPAAAGVAARRLRYVINTSAVTEHVGGNEAFVAAAGAPQVFAHENVLTSLTEAKVPSRGLPNLTFFGDRMAFSRWFNGDPIEMVHLPNAITDGDVVVVFHGSSVVSTGEIFDYTQFPHIDVARGGSIQGLIAALNRLLTMSFPDGQAQGGTYVIGAHGRICDSAELSNYRNMVTIVRDRVAALIKANMTLEQVKSARPTEDYDSQFGMNPSSTGDMFVEAIYSGLKNAATPKSPSGR